MEINKTPIKKTWDSGWYLLYIRLFKDTNISPIILTVGKFIQKDLVCLFVISFSQFNIVNINIINI